MSYSRPTKLAHVLYRTRRFEHFDANPLGVEFDPEE